jgi:uncharacterized protein (TIGR03089 family)
MDVAAVPGVLALLGPDEVVAGRPLLTFYDDATGERTELTATDLGGWAARTAGLLRDGWGLGIGSRAAVLLPPHWQTAAVLLGAWSIGVAVSFQSTLVTGLVPPPAEPFDALFVSAARLDDWLENVPEAWHRFVLGLTPDGAGSPAVPDGYHDYLTEVRRYPDQAPAYELVPATNAASTDGTSYAEWWRLAEEIATVRGLRPGDRILIDADEHREPATWLLAPLAAGASTVLCANLDPARVADRRATERITRTL